MSTEKIASNNEWVKNLTGLEPPPPTKEEIEKFNEQEKSQEVRNKIKQILQKIILWLIVITSLLGYGYYEYQTRVEVKEKISAIVGKPLAERWGVLAFVKPRIKKRMINKLSKENTDLSEELNRLENLLTVSDYNKRSDDSQVLIDITTKRMIYEQEIRRIRRALDGTE